MSRSLRSIMVAASLFAGPMHVAGRREPAGPTRASGGGQSGAKADPKAGEDEAKREARRAAHEQLRNEVLDQMRTMRMWKLTEELKLDQAAAATVFPILAQFDDRARAIGKERREIGREVFQQTKDGAAPNEARLRELIDRLLANQVKRSALDEERFKALRPALTPLQQAKLLLLLPRLEDDFRRRIRDAMDAQRQAEGRTDGDTKPRRPRRGAKAGPGRSVAEVGRPDRSRPGRVTRGNAPAVARSPAPRSLRDCGRGGWSRAG